MFFFFGESAVISERGDGVGGIVDLSLLVIVWRCCF